MGCRQAWDRRPRGPFLLRRRWRVVLRRGGCGVAPTSRQAEQHTSAHLICKACVKCNFVRSARFLWWSTPLLHWPGDPGPIRFAPTYLHPLCVSWKPPNPQKTLKENQPRRPFQHLAGVGSEPFQALLLGLPGQMDLLQVELHYSQEQLNV